MAKYLVKKIATCKECMGRGMIDHPLWVRYGEYITRRKETGLEMIDYESWFSYYHGIYESREIPPEEINCVECDGEGEIIEEITLQQALKEIFGELPND